MRNKALHSVYLQAYVQQTSEMQQEPSSSPCAHSFWAKLSAFITDIVSQHELSSSTAKRAPCAVILVVYMSEVPAAAAIIYGVADMAVTCWTYWDRYSTTCVYGLSGRCSPHMAIIPLEEPPCYQISLIVQLLGLGSSTFGVLSQQINHAQVNVWCKS